MHVVCYFLILFASIVVQQVFFVPLASYILAEPLFPIIMLIILATATGSVLAESFGFYVGLLWSFAKIDTGIPQGVYPFLLTVICFILGRFLYDRFKAPKTLLLVICTAVAVPFWGLGSIALKVLFVNAYLPSLMEFVQVFLSAIYSSLLCMVVNPLMRKLLVRWEWNG